MIKPLRLLPLILLACLSAVDGRAAQVTIPASKDATIFQSPADNGSGAGNGLFAGTTAMSSVRRALVAFDVAGNVPAGAVIQNVQLTLVLGQVAGGGAGSPTIGLHRASANWTEGTTQQGPPSDSLSGQGQGAAAQGGDVTWNSRSHGATPAQPWTTPGGDFAAAASASLAVGSTINGSFTWSSTAALVSDVQAWLNAPATNNGWLLRNVDESSANTVRTFYSRSVATASFRPQLSITYAIPEPSSAVLGALALTPLVRIRRGSSATKL